MAKKSFSLPTWVQLYFVLGSLLGLVLLVIGCSVGVNTLLTEHIFTPTTHTSPPPRPALLDEPQLDTSELTEEQQARLTEWENDFEAWQQEENSIDYQAESRKQALATSLSLILVGAPVFILHVPFVFRQTKDA